MKNTFHIAAFVIVAAMFLSCSHIDWEHDSVSEHTVATLFDISSLPTVTLEVPLKEWNKLLDAYDIDPQTKKYVKCDLVYENADSTVVVNEVGLRLRGQTSRRRPDGDTGEHHYDGKTQLRHVHFGVNLRKNIKDDQHEINGIRKIVLKYAKEDPTYIRETFCYDLLRRFGVWTAMCTSYCRLFVHIEGDHAPVYYGVYQMQEWIDDKYVERRSGFGKEGGYLWKCAWGANLRDMDDWRFTIDDDSTTSKAYELKEDTDEIDLAKTQIKNFIWNLNHLHGEEFKEWISTHCDIDLLLRTYAVYIAVGHWDDYWNNMNNFYLYFKGKDPTDYVMYMIPYDCDNTLGTTLSCGIQNDAGHADPYHWGLEECTLLTNILSVPDYAELYRSYLLELAASGNDLFNFEASIKRITKWQTLIRPYVPNQLKEDNEISDRPASWSNHQEYRVMEDGKYNWFRVKCDNLREYFQYRYQVPNN